MHFGAGGDLHSLRDTAAPCSVLTSPEHLEVMPTASGPMFSTAASAILALALSALGTAAAAREEGPELARRLLAEGVILPLPELLRRAQDLRPGTLIDAGLQFEREHDAYVYEIHMLDPEGRLWEVEFDAGTGELLELESADPRGH